MKTAQDSIAAQLLASPGSLCMIQIPCSCSWLHAHALILLPDNALL